MRSRFSSAKRLGFERLEARTVLNGTVIVDSQITTPGTLTLSGDNSSNSVVVHQIGKNADGDPIIQVLGAGTKLKNLDTNQTGFAFTFGAKTGDDITAINIELNGGNDVLTFYHTTVVGTINVDMDQGNNVLTMTSVHSTSDAISIEFGDGTNAAALFSVNAGGDFSLTAGNGTNAITLNTVSADTNTRTPDTFTVHLGTGRHNVVVMVNCTDGPGGGTLDISDEGADGVLTGELNKFAHQSDVTTFRFRFGDLRHNKA
jgi:hypothetical protein